MSQKAAKNKVVTLNTLAEKMDSFAKTMDFVLKSMNAMNSRMDSMQSDIRTLQIGQDREFLRVNHRFSVIESKIDDVRGDTELIATTVHLHSLKLGA